MVDKISPVSNVYELYNHLKKKGHEKRKKRKQKFELPPMPPDDAG